MLKLVHLAIVTLLSLVIVNAKIKPPVKHFRGRPFDGFVPKPPKKFEAQSLASSGVSTAWFTQYLDHFDPSEIRTWQQVRHNFFKNSFHLFLYFSSYI